MAPSSNYYEACLRFINHFFGVVALVMLLLLPLLLSSVPEFNSSSFTSFTFSFSLSFAHPRRKCVELMSFNSIPNH